MKKDLKKKQKISSHDIPDKLPVKAFRKMNKKRSFVFYGRAGTGKTTLSATFPGKVLLLDVKDRGTDSISDVEPEQAVGLAIEEWDDFERVYYYLKANSSEYATVVIDTTTQLQQLCILKVLQDQKKSTERAGDWGTMTKRDWGEVASLMKEWITYYRDLNDIGIEVVFLAQDRVFNMDEDEEGDSMLQPEVGPRLSPAVMSHLNASVSFIGNTFIRRKEVTKEVNGKKKIVKKTLYCLRIGPNEVYITKTRKPKEVELPDVIINPDYDKIIKTLNGE